MRCADSKWWWPGTGLNRRRRPFQGRALPLSYLASVETYNYAPRRTRIRAMPAKVGVFHLRCAQKQLDQYINSRLPGQAAETPPKAAGVEYTGEQLCVAGLTFS